MKSTFLISILLLFIGIAIGTFFGKSYFSKPQTERISSAKESTPNIDGTEFQEAPQVVSAMSAQAEPSSSSTERGSSIPQKAYRVWDYVKKNKQAPDGYVGGRNFQNREKRLPLKQPDGKIMRYQEWDVNPKRNGVNRGAERLITSANERAWFTADHYKTFQELKK
jgi:ribonuclease T1